MINFDETIRAIVYQKFCDTGDFMAGIFVKDGENTAIGRVRWYLEDTGDPFRDNDEKQWMEISSKNKGKSVDEILRVIDRMLDELVVFSEMADRRKNPEERYVLRREEGEDYMAFFDRFRKQPFVHSREVTSQ